MERREHKDTHEMWVTAATTGQLIFQRVVSILEMPVPRCRGAVATETTISNRDIAFSKKQHFSKKTTQVSRRDKIFDTFSENFRETRGISHPFSQMARTRSARTNVHRADVSRNQHSGRQCPLPISAKSSISVSAQRWVPMMAKARKQGRREERQPSSSPSWERLGRYA